jgi:hypothetical protein
MPRRRRRRRRKRRMKETQPLSALWAEVEEKSISKDKVKGPARGRGGNQA